MNKDLEFKSQNPTFAKMVDELHDYALINDPELVDGLKWVKAESIKRGISKYQFIHDLLVKYDADQKAKEFVAKVTKKENRKTHCTCGAEKIKDSNFCHKCGAVLK